MPVPKYIRDAVQLVVAPVATAQVLDVGDLMGLGSGTNAVQKLDFVDATGSGTFTLTIEGLTTAAITYSATAATLVSNINTALNAVFGSSQIVASGSAITAISLTFSGAQYSQRPIALALANTASLVQVTLTISITTTGVSATLTRAQDQAWDTSLAQTQTDFAAIFLGVTNQAKTSVQTQIYGNSTPNVAVIGTTGVFEFDLQNADSVNLGDYLGPAQGAGNTIQSSVLTPVPALSQAIGQAAEFVTSGTRVKVRILSKVMKNSQ